MKIADGFLLAAKDTEIGATPAPAAHPLLIKPWISAPAAKARRPVRRCMDARVIPYTTFKAAYMAPGTVLIARDVAGFGACSKAPSPDTPQFIDARV